MASVDFFDLEFDYYIPPDCPVNSDGTIDPANWPKVYHFHAEYDQFLLSFTGMGMPPIKYIDQKGPSQHGSTLLDYRLQPRTIQYVHRRNACGRTGYWNARGGILNWLRPNRQCIDSFGLGRLRKLIPNGAMRDIDAIIQQGPMFRARNPSRWDEWSFTETIRFICPDPTFYDPERREVLWEVDVFDGLIFYESPDWEDHLTFPIVFGSDVVIGTTSLTYIGTWLSFPTIYITGPLQSPTIENTTTDEKIALLYDVAAGEVVTINLSYGNKTVMSSYGNNLIGTLSDDSDLAEFHIAPDPEAAGGVNVFIASGAGGAVGTTEIRMTYYTRYIGI